jgi:hypothetical protein
MPLKPMLAQACFVVFAIAAVFVVAAGWQLLPGKRRLFRTLYGYQRSDFTLLGWRCRQAAAGLSWVGVLLGLAHMSL